MNIHKTNYNLFGLLHFFSYNDIPSGPEGGGPEGVHKKSKFQRLTV